MNGSTRQNGKSRHTGIKMAWLATTIRVGVAVLALMTVANNARAAVQYLGLSDQSAVAEFAGTDTSTCVSGVVTHVSLQAGFSVISSPGSTTSSPLANVTIAIYDNCRNLQLVFAQGFTTNFDLRVDPTLKTAHLHARILVGDAVSNSSGYADVDVVWSGASMADRTTLNSVYQAPGLTITTHANGGIREAIASATVIYGGTDYTPEASVSAFIEKGAF